MTRVAIVVLNWNGFDDTKKCVDSLLSQNYSDLSVVVVENGSADGSTEKLRSLFKEQQYSRVIVLYNNKNLGFAGGVNTGINYALEEGFDAIALFNNDAIADKNWLSSLVSELSDQKPIVTGLLLRKDGETIDSTGDFYSSWGMPFPRGRNKPVHEAPSSGFVFGATGGATLYKASIFKEIGLFDETFFAYYEDVDLSFRAQLAGHKVFYTDKAVAYHSQGATSSKIPGFTVYQTFKNIPLLFWKNVPRGLLFRIGHRLILLYTLIFLNSIKNGTGWYATKGVFASIWYFWTKALWRRLKIQSKKTVTNKYIWSTIYKGIPPEQTGMKKLFAIIRPS